MWAHCWALCYLSDAIWQMSPKLSVLNKIPCYLSFWWAESFGRAVFTLGCSQVSAGSAGIRGHDPQLVNRLSLLLGKLVPLWAGLSMKLLECPCDRPSARASKPSKHDFPGYVSIFSCASWFLVTYFCLLVGLGTDCWMLDTKNENPWRYLSLLQWSLSWMKMCFSLRRRHSYDERVISVWLGLSWKSLGPCFLVQGFFLRIWQATRASLLKALEH